MNAPKSRFFQHFWPVAGAVCVLLAMFAGFIGYQASAQFSTIERGPQQEHPLLPPGVSLKPIFKPVIGDLGGMPVTFPPGFVNNVEYEGDPGFGEKRKGPIPTRTHQSQFTSLGFDVRVPDFEILSYKDRVMDKRKYSIFNTPWIDVGITAGPFFGDGQFLERSVDWMNSNERYQYEKLPVKQFDLDVYTPVGVDMSLRDYRHGVGYKSNSNDKDMFVHYDADGKVDVFIECDNRHHDAAPCSQYFFLAPSLRIKFHASYRRGMLPQWKHIQESTKKVLYRFEAR